MIFTIDPRLTGVCSLGLVPITKPASTTESKFSMISPTESPRSAIF
ncbi:unannotated protein [freshwater metagenome]|uniref:Unannotated protein n=1 Tax=freshwater metagenome TaxID=449393 RepID=A0A6J6KCG7_9ZZZZ